MNFFQSQFITFCIIFYVVVILHAIEVLQTYFIHSNYFEGPNQFIEKFLEMPKQLLIECAVDINASVVISVY